jgi:hypothetical protein
MVDLRPGDLSRVQAAGQAIGEFFPFSQSLSGMGFLLTKIFGAFFLGTPLILAMKNSRNSADQSVVYST